MTSPYSTFSGIIPRLPSDDMPVWAGISSVTLAFTLTETIVGDDYDYAESAAYSSTVTTRHELGPGDTGIEAGQFDILGSDDEPSHSLGAVVNARFEPEGVIGSWTLTDLTGTSTGDIEDAEGYGFELKRCPEVHPDFTDLGEREARQCQLTGMGLLTDGPTTGWAGLLLGGTVVFTYELVESTVLGLRTINMEIEITLA